MVEWYKHDIIDWMDATESLDAEAYRTFHTIVQLIYLNEGPIRNNERGIAGRCKQSLRTYRRALRTLKDLNLIGDESGKIQNVRASIEIKNIVQNRLNGSRGGKSPRKSLKNKYAGEAPLQKDSSLLEKRREEKNHSDANASDAGASSDPRTRLFNEGLRTLAKITGKGPDACRSFVGKCLKAAGDDAVVVLGLIEDAARNQTANPSAWIAARLKNPEVPNGKAHRGSVIDAWDRLIQKAAGNDSDEGPDAVVIIPPRPIQRS